MRRRLTGSRRGAVIPLVCVLIVVLLGAAAMAVDLGRLHYTAAEAQTAADAAALAAASATQHDPNNDSRVAPARALALAQRNRAANAPGSVGSADVVPVTYNPATRAALATVWTGSANGVQVTARARPSTAFLGTFGRSAPSVARASTAWIANVEGAACVRPFALPYTRIYEDAYTNDRRYTAKTEYAPNLSQQQVAELASDARSLPATRTFVLIPPSEEEEAWDRKGRPNTGSWHTVNFSSSGYSGFTSFLSAPVGSAQCKPATTRVGEYVRPFSWDREDFEEDVLEPAKTGMLRLCNRTGNLRDGRCRDARGNVGVEARMPFTDSIPSKSGPFSQRVRMISQVRVMCYFMFSDDACPATTILNPDGRSVPWQMPTGPSGSPVDRGYPKGTIVVLLDGPTSIDITRDVEFGNTVSYTQRLLLVK